MERWHVVIDDDGPTEDHEELEELVTAVDRDAHNFFALMHDAVEAGPSFEQIEEIVVEQDAHRRKAYARLLGGDEMHLAEGPSVGDWARMSITYNLRG